MKQEIERKYLVDGSTWRDNVVGRRWIRQGYISTRGDSTVRVRQYKTHGELAVKGPTEGASRLEYEYNIGKQDARELIESFCQNRTVEKWRHRIRYGDDLWVVDTFTGRNEGLTLAEIELEDEQQDFELPDWCGREVTGDRRFRNAYLAQQPIDTWSDEECAEFAELSSRSE